MDTRSRLLLAAVVAATVAGCKDNSNTASKPAAKPDKSARASKAKPPPPTPVNRPWRRHVKQLPRKVTVLAAGLNRVRAMTLGEAHVYWIDGALTANDGRLMRVAKAGGKPQVIAKGFRPSSSHLVMDGRRLYLVANGAVHYIDKNGGALTLQHKSAKQVDAVDAHDIYWIGGDRVYRWPKNNLTKGEPIHIASGQRQARSLVSDGKHVYWLVSTGAGSKLVRRAAGGGNIDTVTTLDAAGGARALKLDGESYWLLRADQLTRGSLAKGKKPQPVAVQRPPLHAFSVDEKHVVWPYGQLVYALDKSSAREVAYTLDWGTTEPRPHLSDGFVASDARYVYLTTAAAPGQVRLIRVAK